eukprot:537561-Alexandrium_andersonii.AAC.1
MRVRPFAPLRRSSVQHSLRCSLARPLARSRTPDPSAPEEYMRLKAQADHSKRILKKKFPKPYADARPAY